MASWTPHDVPDQTGRIIVITGANSGIGAAAAEALAGRGAQVVMAARNEAAAEATRAAILRRVPGARLVTSKLDLADLASVRDFAARTSAAYPHVDILLNNAGLGMQPTRDTTTDGFERQFGTNHLGHFALTGLLMPSLLRATMPRVVAISSIAHRMGRITFDDLQGERAYSGGQAYNQSKLANLMFALELDRRAQAARSRLVSVAAHPGVSTTGFLANSRMPGYQLAIAKPMVRLIGQDAERGSWPGIYAAAMPDVRGGQYWGPDGLLEFRGRPAPAKVAAQGSDSAVWSRLWAESERLTGVTYPPLA